MFQKKSNSQKESRMVIARWRKYGAVGQRIQLCGMNKFQRLMCSMVCICAKSLSVMSNSLWPCELQPTCLLCPWDSPGKHSGVGCHNLLQGILPTQGLNPCLLCLLHWQVGSCHQHHMGSPCSMVAIDNNTVLYTCDLLSELQILSVNTHTVTM